MSGEAQLEALLEIINSSARIPPPRFCHGHCGPQEAVRLLEGACQQLCASLAPPRHTVVNFSQCYNWACTGAAIRKGTADVLDEYPSGLHVGELSQIVCIEKGKLARTLRVLASRGCFSEVGTDSFANNHLSLIMKGSNDCSCLPCIHAQDVSRGAGALYEALTDPDCQAKRRENYYRAMIALGPVMGSLSILHHYPWNEVVALCDVGASIGSVSIHTLKSPDQDLPEVLESARGVWQKEAPEALREQRVEFVTRNFLKEAPVAGKDVYYLRNIIHDWPDTEAAVILRNISKAMEHHSRLLISHFAKDDYVITGANRRPDEMHLQVDIAPEPMLPNFGAGNSRKYQQDPNMWILHNAKERSIDEQIALASSAGLKLAKVYDLAETAVLEFRLAWTLEGS
ncbi:S-adenosyl-L-methionine-dependent methyltransferase [Pisolithus thermaeus]|nr:S-adenosyl-L-methionine-dependent methyltransferase [Pisolithus thermaeus]